MTVKVTVKTMKRISIVLGFMALLLILVGIIRRAAAADSSPPVRLDMASAIRLDRDMAHLREADAAIARIREEVRTYDADALVILTAAKIDPKAFARGDVRVNFVTGEITRSAPQVATK